MKNSERSRAVASKSTRSRLVSQSKIIALRLLVLIVAVVVSAGIFELVSRVFIGVPWYRYTSDDETHWNIDHPDRNYALTPGYRGQLASDEFVNRMEFNSLGLRGPEPDLEAPSAFIVGDSFVYGIGAEFNETIGARLQEHLKTQQGRDLQVWNLGVPSYAFPRYFMMLEEYLQHSIPEVVVYCAYYGVQDDRANDLLGAVEFQNDRQELDRAPRIESKVKGAEQSATELPRVQFLKNWLSRNSSLYTAVRALLWPKIRLQFVRNPDLSGDLQARLDAGWKIFDAELSRLKALSIEHGFEVVLVSIPSRYGMADRTPASVERFRNLVAKFGFRSFDGIGTLTKEDSLNLYYQRDGHLNPSGYDFFAREIEKALRD